eukprot:CAMPEP_0118725068 /NCGR_PEP_ID=MMETSP0800-20121206/32938_1 /TAXON_ID=210618 ORGANISM="Striatella unipunctata, Strain CCMP2910" /NCGR_SAMPLE_ID=MMETSP0800 /ASSEMBLY_ACC=CAM_ASM_000638 /LENGTH=63 /DNA_ID=CAMNT_0006633733 /DNA_START=405 /DNA_END=596 /DNA_ORIENTATION=-
MSTKKCGAIEHNGRPFKVEWESETQRVWVVDEKGYRKNYGDAKAENESAALECAKEMLHSSGV